MKPLAALGLVGALGLVACQSTSGSSTDDELAGAKTQVHRLFDAVDKRDCTTIEALVPTAAGKCDTFLHEWREDLHVSLVDTPEVKRDGRDKRAIIVTTTVMRHGEKQTMLIRATHEKGAWQLAL
jgi:hypothetical protein